MKKWTSLIEKKTSISKKQIAELLGQNPMVLSHSVNVFLLTNSVLKNIQGRFASEEERSLLAAALFHDIGKSYWPDRWHTEPKHKLSQTDFTVMQMHPIQGVNILKERKIMDPLVFDIIEQHHERPEGKGYPHQLKNIHPLALVLAACDVYAACTEFRPYRKRSLTANEAIQEVGKFAPECVLKALIQSQEKVLLAENQGVLPQICHC
jgi:putative nucleotidyltransferase with HDIG domain